MEQQEQEHKQLHQCEPVYIFLLQNTTSGQKYIFYDIKEALEKGFLLQATVTRIRRYPHGRISEMVIYEPRQTSPSLSPNQP
jgi:hypothetical protein